MYVRAHAQLIYFIDQMCCERFRSLICDKTHPRTHNAHKHALVMMHTRTRTHTHSLSTSLSLTSSGTLAQVRAQIEVSKQHTRKMHLRAHARAHTPLPASDAALPLAGLFSKLPFWFNPDVFTQGAIVTWWTMISIASSDVGAYFTGEAQHVPRCKETDRIQLPRPYHRSIHQMWGGVVHVKMQPPPPSSNPFLPSLLVHR